MFHLLSSPLELAGLVWFLGGFFLLLLKRPRWGVFLILFFHPLYLIKFQAGLIPLNVLEIMVGILFLRHPRVGFGGSKILSLGVLFLFVGAGISTLFSSDFLASAGIFKSWFFVPLLFYWSVKDLKEKDKYILRPLALNGLFLSLGVFVFWFLDATIFDGRVALIYQSPNELAMVLGVSLLAFLAYFKDAGWPKKMSGIFMAWALALTQSLGAAVSVATSVFSRIIKKHLKAFFVLYILAVIFLVGFLPWLGISAKEVMPTLDSRFAIWRAAGLILKDNWLLGIGPGTFQEQYLAYQENFSPYPEWAVPHAHNLFLYFWLETGLLGFLGFLLILCWLYKATWRLHSSVVAVVVFFLVFGLVDTPWKNDLALIFWALLAYFNEGAKSRGGP